MSASVSANECSTYRFIRFSRYFLSIKARYLYELPLVGTFRALHCQKGNFYRAEYLVHHGKVKGNRVTGTVYVFSGISRYYNPSANCR